MPISPETAQSGPGIPVSPLHRIELAEAIRRMIEEPPDHDYVIRTLSSKTVNRRNTIPWKINC